MIGIKKIANVMLCVPFISFAGVQIYPVRLDLTAPKPIGAFTIINDNRDKSAPGISMNATLVSWAQENGRNIYKDNPADLFLIPLIFTVASDSSQIIRISLANPPDPLREKDYRVIFKEFTPQRVNLPIKNSNTVVNFAIRTNISVPVFIPPVAPEKISALFSARLDADRNAVILKITNTGNTHIHLLEAKLKNPAGLIGASNKVIYILPGSTMSEMIKTNKSISLKDNITVQLSTDDVNYPKLTGTVTL